MINLFERGVNIIIICGLIITIIGTLLLQYTKYKNELTVTTCQEDLLQEIKNQESESGNNSYLLIFTGNCTMIFGLLFIFLINSKNSNNVSEFLGNLLPIVLTMGIITYNLILNFSYKNRLIMGNIANEYYSYSLIESILLFFQMILIFRFVDNINNNRNKNNLDLIIITISLVILILNGIKNIVLKFFSTDG